MSISTEEKELTIIIGHICDYMAGMVSPTGEQAAVLRRQIGDMKSNGVQYLMDNVFGTNLWNCFVTARTLPITANTVAVVREKIYTETPTGPIAHLVVNSAILYCLTTESVLLTGQTFKCSDDVIAMMKRMKAAFDAAREVAADAMDSATYQNVTYLAGSLINHLNLTALQLPKIVQFSYQTNLPSLFLANLIYQDTTRSDELIDENKVVHPLFMPLQIQGLSA